MFIGCSIISHPSINDARKRINAMRTIPTLLCAVASLLTPSTNAFVPLSRFGVVQRSGRHVLSATEQPVTLTKQDIIGKEFQLEEREDQDTEITELWFNEDGTVAMGKTDGPPVEKFWGIWTLRDSGEKPFRMEFIRTYSGGEHTGKNQMGEFAYEVKREFWGDLQMVGDSVGIIGSIHGDDETAHVDCEVGFFSLIDASSEEVKVSREESKVD